MTDWFDQNAPQQKTPPPSGSPQATGGNDWFAANEPPSSSAGDAATPSTLDRVIKVGGDTIGNLAKGATGDVMRPPDASGDMVSRVVNGFGNNLGRTTQAWHDTFTGNPSAQSVAEMVPLVGPAAVDAGRMIGTPGQRTEGFGAATSLLAPFAAHGIELPSRPSLNLAEGDVPTAGTGARLLSATKTGLPDVAKGLAKVGTGAAIDALTPGPMRYPAMLATYRPLISGGARQIGRGFQAGVEDFRGPRFGPEPPPAGPTVPADAVARPPMPVTPAGVARIGTTPAERITALSQSDEGTLGTRAEMMRQLRLADQAGASNSAKQDIIRRFERPEYTPRQFDPRESEIIAPSLTVPESPASTVNPPSSEPPTFANGRIKINVRRK